MAWEDCVANIQRSFKPAPAQDAGSVSWSTVPQDVLDNDTFKDGKPFILICPDRHCVDNVNQSPADHQLCHCLDINNQPIPGCTPAGALYPEKAQVCINITNPSEFNGKTSRACTRQGDSWYQLTCYCCCSCFANGTRIAIPDGTRVIEEFVIGDKVLTASLGAASAGDVKLSWSPAKVAFSSGTGPDGFQSAMVYIHHGQVGSIIATPDQLFLMSTGKLKRADRLVPGKDFFVSQMGTPVAINEVSVGEYKGGVHHIATDKEFTGSVDDHLLLSEGIVSGDFNLQIRSEQLIASGLLLPHDELPKIGSDAYVAAHGANLVTGQYKSKFTSNAVAALGLAAPTNQNVRKFFVFGHQVASVPATAAAFLSPLQEADVQAKVDQADFAEAGVGAALVQYVLRLFRGFYPDVNFVQDTGQLRTNAFAFTEYGQQFVVLPGGLTRIRGLGLGGFALILAHMVTRLHKSPPYDANGYTSIGMADYYSSGVLRTIFFGTGYSSTFSEGLKEVTDAVFSCIPPAHQAYETDPFKPSVDTRLDAFGAGDAMAFPPDGIGGPELGGLKVTGATAQAPTVSATLFVSQDIDAKTAAQLYADLSSNGIIDAKSTLAPGFSLETDLSFLFERESDAAKKQYLTETVRGLLLHLPATVQVNFNVPVEVSSASDAADYAIQPLIAVGSVHLAPDGRSALLAAAIKAGVDYTVTVRSIVRAVGGSTLDSDNATAKFRLA